MMQRALLADEISALFNIQDQDGSPGYWLFAFIGPSRTALGNLIDEMEKAPLQTQIGIDAVIKHAAVSFDLAGITGAQGLVVGRLSLDRFASGRPPQKFQDAINELNSPNLAGVRAALVLASVESDDLRRLRADWIACARRLATGPSVDDEAEAAAENLTFSVGLSAISYGWKGGCKGLSCPSTPKVISR